MKLKKIVFCHIQRNCYCWMLGFLQNKAFWIISWIRKHYIYSRREHNVYHMETGIFGFHVAVPVNAAVTCFTSRFGGFFNHWFDIIIPKYVSHALSSQPFLPPSVPLKLWRYVFPYIPLPGTLESCCRLTRQYWSWSHKTNNFLATF